MATGQPRPWLCPAEAGDASGLPRGSWQRCLAAPSTPLPSCTPRRMPKAQPCRLRTSQGFYKPLEGNNLKARGNSPPVNTDSWCTGGGRDEAPVPPSPARSTQPQHNQQRRACSGLRPGSPSPPAPGEPFEPSPCGAVISPHLPDHITAPRTHRLQELSTPKPCAPKPCTPKPCAPKPFRVPGTGLLGGNASGWRFSAPSPSPRMLCPSTGAAGTHAPSLPGAERRPLGGAQHPARC